MNYLVKINRKKIFPDRFLLLVVISCLLCSVFSLRKEQSDYLTQNRLEIADGSEYRYLLKNTSLDENIVTEKLNQYRDNTFPEDFTSIKIEDYYLMKNITQVYGMDSEKWPKTGKSFYQDRENQIKKQCVKQSYFLKGKTEEEQSLEMDKILKHF